MNYLIHDSADNTYLIISIRLGKLYHGGWRDSLSEVCTIALEVTGNSIDEEDILNSLASNHSYTLLLTTPKSITL
ncbi:MAG: hypothetical protein ACYDD5_01020 [Sulfuricurvum sp.]